MPELIKISIDEAKQLKKKVPREAKKLNEYMGYINALAPGEAGKFKLLNKLNLSNLFYLCGGGYNTKYFIVLLLSLNECEKVITGFDKDDLNHEDSSLCL